LVGKGWVELGSYNILKEKDGVDDKNERRKYENFEK